MIRNLRCTVTIDSVLANSKTQNAFSFTMNAIFRHDYPLAVEPTRTPRPLVQKKNLERFSTYWYAPFCRVCLGCCAVEFGNPGGTYDNPVYREARSAKHQNLRPYADLNAGNVTYEMFQNISISNLIRPACLGPCPPFCVHRLFSSNSLLACGSSLYTLTSDVR